MAEACFQVGILFIVCIAAILSASTLILVAVRNNDSQTKDEHTRPEKGQPTVSRRDEASNSITDPQQFCEQSTDVAIIGAGITGSYAAWRLRHANLSVTLYEYSDRIGGRCHTVTFPDIPDINVELGAMRFHPERHVILNKTLSNLGLETIDFLPQLSQFQYFLRATHLSPQNVLSHPPYRLKTEHIQRIDKLMWEIFNNNTNVNSSIDGYLDITNRMKYTTLDGVPLYKQSVLSFNGKYLYPELAAFLEDASGFSSAYQDMTAADTIPTGDPDLPTGPTYKVRTVVKGFQAIPETMVEQFLNSSNRHSFKPNHHLKSIVKLDDGQYGLTFQPTVTNRGVTTESTAGSVRVCAKTVMLAIPRLALEHLDWTVLKDTTIADYIQNALFEAHAGKLYFAYDTPWWRNTINYSPTVYSTTPLRITYDFGDSKATNKTVLNVAYNDMYTDIWRDILTQGHLVPGIGDESMRVTDVAQDMARKYLAKIYGTSIDDVPKPNQAIMRVWSEYPIGAAWYRWRQGYHWINVADHMLKPSDPDNVFIISNTFSSTGHQSWTEGGLEIVDNMMKKYFPKFYNL